MSPANAMLNVTGMRGVPDESMKKRPPSERGQSAGSSSPGIQIEPLRREKISVARAVAKTKQCIYCGRTIKGVRRGEHVIPEAIGGRKTIPVVCAPCNSGPLSDIDRELCSRSAMSLAALKALGNSLETSWEINHGADRLLLKARNDPRRGIRTERRRCVRKVV